MVFVHGLLVNANLWRKVVPDIAAAGYRCQTPDWPRAHSISVPEADLAPTGLADPMTAFLERLDPDDATLVANETGGAIAQIMLSRSTERIGRVVLASADCYERLLPLPFNILPPLAKIPDRSGR